MYHPTIFSLSRRIFSKPSGCFFLLLENKNLVHSLKKAKLILWKINLKWNVFYCYILQGFALYLLHRSKFCQGFLKMYLLLTEIILKTIFFFFTFTFTLFLRILKLIFPSFFCVPSGTWESSFGWLASVNKNYPLPLKCVLRKIAGTMFRNITIILAFLVTNALCSSASEHTEKLPPPCDK